MHRLFGVDDEPDESAKLNSTSSPWRKVLRSVTEKTATVGVDLVTPISVDVRSDEFGESIAFSPAATTNL